MKLFQHLKNNLQAQKVIYSSLSGNIILLISTSLVSYFLCKVIIYFSLKTGFLDQPNEFRQHNTPTPYFGGIAIFISMLSGTVALCIVSDTPVIQAFSFLILFFPFFLVGLIDDIFKLSSLPKLFLIIIAALIPCSSWFIELTLMNAAFLFICLIFFSNAFNLLDNIDGLCASTATAILLVILITNYNILPAIALAAIAGFLILNKPKAKIFMGDSGSLYIGALCIIFTVVKCNFNNYCSFNTLILLPLFWLPIYDTVSVIIVRINAGKSILIGGKDHFSHRLMKRGMSNTAVIVVLFIITLSAGIISHFLTPLLSIALFVFIVSTAASFELLTSKK
ncbi:undecaprenyl/decaprenyl-phosphate alpha-N-acetylglucosaminyl 1-phosphate transferase [bacterium]|nr:undecaprenyl/decaprenyl-phosphate alpha-N-acetylglucosaminyl 1-phosphate transferase [bacterium]